jgi:hypothetical protein
VKAAPRFAWNSCREQPLAACVNLTQEFPRMKTTKLALAMMLATGLAAAPFAAQAKSHKAKHESSTSSSQTTGANTKSKGADPSGQGGSGPGSDQGGTMTNKGTSNTK